jgi:aerobic carbon-monoxide dehydrogenase large subunit
LTKATNNPFPIPSSVIGKPVRRHEDARLLTGKGRFTDDFSLDGQTYAAVVRSPHPHARLVWTDVTAARSMPGVLGIFTGADCAADGLLPISHNPLPSTRYDLKLTPPGDDELFVGPHRLLAVERVRHVGEAVALVVAETKAQALDAAEAVSVDYQALPWVADAKAACAAGAPAVWDEVPDNVLIDTVFGNANATERAFAGADRVVKMEFHVPRVTAAAMEPRAALGHYDTATGRYTLYAGSGGAVRQKHEIAAVLRIAPEQLRVLSYDVGRSFGSKNRVYVEAALVLRAARKLGRPVKFTATRSEAFLTDYQGRDLVTAVELALRSDGRFLALRASNISDVGAYCVSLSPLGKGSALITGSYDIPAATLRARAVFTNTMPTNAYRSSGRPEVTYAIERLIDIAAQEMGIDRIELRRKNLIAPEAMPYTNAVGARYDSGQPIWISPCASPTVTALANGARRRQNAAGCSDWASRTMSNPRSALRASGWKSPSTPRRGLRSSSAPSRVARAMKPASPRW